VIDFVKKSGGIEYATQVMQTYHSEALQILNSFQESVYKTSLEQLVTFTIERTK
jgi:octaprenyl-diphosphate synthase